MSLNDQLNLSDPALTRRLEDCAGVVRRAAALLPEGPLADRWFEASLKTFVTQRDLAPGAARPKYDPREGDAIRGVYRRLVATAVSRGFRVDAQTLRELHLQLLRNSARKDLIPGRFRERLVSVDGEIKPEAARVPELVDRLRSTAFFGDLRAEDLDKQTFALVQALVQHVRIAKIHPFLDGNGRVARAVELGVLVGGGIPPWIGMLLHDHYAADRNAYSHCMGFASLDNPGPFVCYALQGLEHRLKGRLAELLRLHPRSRRSFLRAGYSLLELLAVVTIVGVVAGVVLPRVTNSTGQADATVELFNVRQITSAIEAYYATNGTFPSSLDSALTTFCGPSNPFFGNVLGVGITDSRWTKISSTIYLGPTGAAYEYDSILGRFAAATYVPGTTNI